MGIFQKPSDLDIIKQDLKEGHQRAYLNLGSGLLVGIEHVPEGTLAYLSMHGPQSIAALSLSPVPLDEYVHFVKLPNTRTSLEMESEDSDARLDLFARAVRDASTQNGLPHEEALDYLIRQYRVYGQHDDVDKNTSLVDVARRVDQLFFGCLSGWAKAERDTLYAMQLGWEITYLLANSHRALLERKIGEIDFDGKEGMRQQAQRCVTCYKEMAGNALEASRSVDAGIAKFLRAFGTPGLTQQRTDIVSIRNGLEEAALIPRT